MHLSSPASLMYTHPSPPLSLNQPNDNKFIQYTAMHKTFDLTTFDVEQKKMKLPIMHSSPATCTLSLRSNYYPRDPFSRTISLSIYIKSKPIVLVYLYLFTF